MVLDRLEGRDRAAELLADLRVLGRLLGGLAGDAAASAANTARATSVSSPRAPGSTVAGAASSLTLAARRLWSRLAGTSA